MNNDEFLRIILQKGDCVNVGGKVFFTPRNNSVPRRLFKYRAANDFLYTLLRNRTIYHAAISSFNDPLEGIKAYRLEATADDIEAFFVRLSANVENESERRAQLQQLVEHYTRNQEQFTEQLRRQYLNDLEHFGIACFTTKCDNFNMWSFYADNHRGVCLEFDFSKEMENVKGDEYDPTNSYVFCIRKLHYAGDVPVVHVRDLMAERFSPIYHKCTRFKWEEEYRSIRSAVGSYTFVPACLRAVYVGLNTSDDTVDRIRQLLVDEGLHWVAMKRMVRQPGTYDLATSDIH